MTPTIAKEEQEAITSDSPETQEDATTFMGSGGDEIVIDLSAEAVAEGADILEDVAFDTLKSNSKKRSFDASSGNDDNYNQTHKKKQRSSNNNKKKKMCSYDSSILNESTTIEDLQTIDASAYLAWVNSQAGALPSVFVADEQQNDKSSVISAINKGSSKKDDEGPIDGSAATLHILLSKRMDILPPPTIHHIPPTSCSASIFLHIDGSESSTEDDVVDVSEDPDGTNKTNNWLNTTISSFSKLRSYLETQDALRKQTTSNNNHNNVDNDDDDNPHHSIRKIAVPKMKDRSGWHVFCLGREEAFGNKGGYFEDVPDSDSEHDKSASGDIDDVDDEDEQSSKVNDDIKVKSEDQGDGSASSATNTLLTYNEEQVPPSGYTPTTSLLLQLDQVLTRVLFHHHVHYLCEWKFPLSHQRAAWIYALLARMNKPWHRDECCAVRRVLRECCSRRYELSLPTTTSSVSETTTTRKDNNNNSTNEENDKKWEQLAMLNTLIAVTGVYYEQGSKAGGDGMDVLFSVSDTT